MPKISQYLQLVLARNACMICMDEWRTGGQGGKGLQGETAEEIQMKIQLNRRQGKFKPALTPCSRLLLSLDFSLKCSK